MTTPAPADRTHHRFDGIQYLRAIAALLVVLCHAEMTFARPQYLGRQVAAGWLEAGAIGVDLFFVVSGFIMYHATDGLRAGPGRTRRFMLGRAIRILPFMWCCVAVYLAIGLALHRDLDTAPYLRAFVLSPVGELSPWEVWSLRHEMLFYMAVACALSGVRWRIVVLLFVLGAIPSGWFIDRGPEGPLQAWVAAVWSPRANLAFGAGLLVGLLRKAWQPSPTKVLSMALGAGLLASPAVLLSLGVWLPATVVGEPLAQLNPPDLVRALLMVPVLAVIVYAASLLGAARHGSTRFLSHVGDASYSIYLTHVVFVTAVAKAQHAGQIDLPGWLLVTAALLLAVLMGSLIHRYAELPMQRALKRRWLSREAPGRA